MANSNIDKMKDNGPLEGTIVKGIAGFYYVKSGDEVYRCKARGVFKQQGLKPAVGDRVIMEVIPDNDDSLIKEILPRKNSFIRPFVANVDCFIIVTAASKPAPVLSVIDRFLVMAEKAGTDIIICINKCDLAEPSLGKKAVKVGESIEQIRSIYQDLYPVVCLDCIRGTGFSKLTELMDGKTSALAGPSGVGKSTILNRLLPHAMAETGNISEKSQRGKHTTRHSELFTIDDFRDTKLFDTPGFTSFDVLEAEETELQRLFPEMASRLGECKYSNCLHVAEPDCQVRKAVENKEIDINRYESYKSMLEEIRKAKQY